jgi:hypothetical protein
VAQPLAKEAPPPPSSSIPTPPLPVASQNFLDKIHKGVELRHVDVEKVAEEKKVAEENREAAQPSFKANLKAMLEQRRKAINPDDEGD